MRLRSDTQQFPLGLDKFCAGQSSKHSEDATLPVSSEGNAWFLHWLGSSQQGSHAQPPTARQNVALPATTLSMP